MNFEKGIEILIPTEFRQDDLPISLKYYDPILSIISENLSGFRKQTFLLKKYLGFMFADNDNKIKREGFIEKQYYKNKAIEDSKDKKFFQNSLYKHQR